MTENELRKYLDEYREERHAVKCLVESYDCIIEEHKKYDNIYSVRENIKLIQACRKRELEKFHVKTATVMSWSELISNETYRQIFRDRYVKCLTWSEIHDRYYYCPSQYHHIMTKCRKEIVRKSQIDITADNTILITSVQ